MSQIKIQDKKLIEDIITLKREQEAIILAHNYQKPEIYDVADHIGDSLELARVAASSTAKILVFGGVKFMAESAKILSPNKKVLLPVSQAGCSMADMLKVEELRNFKSQYPQAAVVTYVNSSAEVKAESDICCTSANAIEVINSLPHKEVLFGPDKNLAAWVAKHSDKKIIAWQGYCEAHNVVDKENVLKAKQSHSQAKVIVHPECSLEVCELADAVLSTSGMLRYAKEDRGEEFIIGTEIGMLALLKKQNPDKKFYPLNDNMLCEDMKLTTLETMLKALTNLKTEIVVPDNIAQAANSALAAMLKVT